jgi:DNA-binding beta-propeller fold protein YncE
MPAAAPIPARRLSGVGHQPVCFAQAGYLCHCAAQRAPARRLTSLAVLTFLALALPIFAAGTSTNQARLVWPAPPDPARVEFVQSISSPRDAGIKIPPLKKVANWFTGEDPGNEPLLKPFAVAFDADANLVATDTGANAVVFFNRKDKKWRRWTTIGKLRFASPVGVAKQGNQIFVADSVLGAVIVFNPDGKLLRTITNQLERPVAVALLNDRLFVADSQQHAIRVFRLDGTADGGFGQRGTGAGEFNFPTHLAARGNRLYVTDSMNSRVQVLDPSGRFLAQVGRPGDGPGAFSRPKGVALDTEGRAYIVDAMADNVQIFDAEGRLLLALGGSGQAPGQFWLPAGIAISPRNEIAVADSYNHRLQLFQLLTPP